MSIDGSIYKKKKKILNVYFPSTRHSSSLSKRLCKSGEEVNTEGLESSLLQLPADSTDRSQNVWQWILESDRQTKHKPHRSVLQLYGHVYVVTFIFWKFLCMHQRVLQKGTTNL